MLVALPIGLWIFSLVSDVMYHAGPQNIFWKNVAFYTMAGGIVGALLAAIPGFIDYLSLKDRRLKKIATTHMVLNLVVVALFIFNLGARYSASTAGDMFGLVLSVVGIAILAASGWLGGILVYEHRVGVSEPREERDTQRRVA
jgi:uncharacterized membrane protein